MRTSGVKKVISLVREHLHSVSSVYISGEHYMSFARRDWALALITELGYVEGATRLHKYAFLAAKRVKGLTDAGFYNDWEPSNYGPFSKTLAQDINNLVVDGLLKQHIAPNKYGFNVVTFEPTEEGIQVIEDRRKFHARQFGEVKKMLAPYQKERLMKLLSDVYYLYPAYATKSKIRAEVGRQVYESDSWLNPDYD